MARVVEGQELNPATPVSAVRVVGWRSASGARLAVIGEGVVAAAGLGEEGAIVRLRGEEQREALTQPTAEGVATASQPEEPRHRRN